MAPAKPSSDKDTYSVILPTFNERQNLPIITWLLNRTFTEKFVDPITIPHPPSSTNPPIPSLLCILKQLSVDPPLTPPSPFSLATSTGSS